MELMTCQNITHKIQCKKGLGLRLLLVWDPVEAQNGIGWRKSERERHGGNIFEVTIYGSSPTKEFNETQQLQAKEPI